MDNWRIFYFTGDRNVEGGGACYQPQMNLVSGEKGGEGDGLYLW